MDPFKLLSRSTKLSRASREKTSQSTPSSGRITHPQLFASDAEVNSNGHRKRKRGQGNPAARNNEGPAVEFFKESRDGAGLAESHEGLQRTDDVPDVNTALQIDAGHEDIQTTVPLALEERKRIFKKHKLKVTWLNPTYSAEYKRQRPNLTAKALKARAVLYPNPLRSLQDLKSNFGVSARISSNVAEQGYLIPTEVQLAALPLLLGDPEEYLSDVHGIASGRTRDSSRIDLLTVAPTGSGKTIAFMIPLLQSLLSERRGNMTGSRHTSAIILAPTKELASQITNEGRKLARGTGLTISQMRKGMELPKSSSHQMPADPTTDNFDGDEDRAVTTIKAHIVVSTPGILQSIINNGQKSTWRIRHLVLDEADVLLDPLFREQTLDIWNNLEDPDLRVSMWSATMGSNIEELARSTIRDRLHRLEIESGNELPKAPLIRLVVGLKDAAVPNVQHIMTYAGTEKGKLMGLRQLLHPVSSSSDSVPALRPPFLVFTQTIERAIALHSELLYDIPAEAGGSSRIAVLHADLSDAARDAIMTRFRKGEIWVLITTDLLSRGVDFRGVNGVVNYDIPTSSAAYVHRIGRTGRAGREGGVAVTLYSKEDIPYLKHVANVVSMAGKQKGADGGVQQWLLDALPRLSKAEKQNLKKRGIESRTVRGQQKDPKAARKSRISTKAGFVRRAEHNRKGAILAKRKGLQRRAQNDEDDESDFAGFD